MNNSEDLVTKNKSKSFAELVEGSAYERLQEKLRQLVVSKHPEKEPQVYEEKNVAPEREPRYLEKGMLYLVENKAFSGGFDVFICTPIEPIDRLTLDEVSPASLIEAYDQEKLHIKWITNISLGDLVDSINGEFEEGGQRLILIEGFEHLFRRITFDDAKNTIQNFRKGVASTNSIQIISVNPTVIEKHILTLLRQEADAVIRRG